MSGVAGVIDTNNRPGNEPQVLNRMLRIMQHRGPAGELAQREDGVQMGIRFSHPPASPKDAQPFVDEGQEIWVVLEGRIFNHTHLRRKLADQGLSLQGDSDAELVARLYQAHGLDCLAKLDGEFSFALWDGREKRFFAARDRLGVHHLFYTFQDGVIYFGSEAKSILASGKIERRLDLKAIDQVMFMNCPVAPRTMFEGVSAIPAGHFLLIQDGQARHQPYWDLEYTPEPFDPDKESDYQEELLAMLDTAVRIRIPSEKKVGVYLSGGLDSSTITALMRKNGLKQFPAYLADFVLPAYSEQRQAQITAKANGLELNIAAISFQLIAEYFPKLVWHGEASLVLSESAALLALAQRAAQDADVVLNGEGGDELLAGYVFNDWDRIFRRLQRFPLSLTLPVIRALLPKIGFPRAFVLSAEEQRPAYEHLGCFPAPLFYNYAVREVNAFYSDDFRQQANGYCPEAEIAQVLDTDKMARWDPLSQSLYFSTKINLPNYLLGPHGDRAVSSAGLEAFFPFLDHHLMEFAARLPNKLKVNGRQEKYLLKEAMRGILPDEIVNRRKSPMTSPTSPAFVGPGAPAYVQRLLSPQAIKETGFFDAQRVAQMVSSLSRRDPTKDRNNRMDVMLSFPLVGILSLQILNEVFIENFSEEPPTWN